VDIQSIIKLCGSYWKFCSTKTKIKTGVHNVKNKKTFLSLLLLLIVGISIFIYHHQTNADTVKVRIGQSKKFTGEEINAAVNTVKSGFDIGGSRITDIWYSEKESNGMLEDYKHSANGSWITDVKKENAIVIFYNFEAISDDSGWEPGTHLDGYCWILVRDSKKGEWRVKYKTSVGI